MYLLRCIWLKTGVGDATRTELQFDPGEPSYYFLQLNSGKKSLALNAKTPYGKAILTKLIEGGGVLGWTYKCKSAGGYDSEIDANNYVYIVLQRHGQLLPDDTDLRFKRA